MLKSYRWFLIGSSLFLLVAACGLGSRFQPTPPPTIPPTPTNLPTPVPKVVEPSIEDSQRARQNYNQALQEAERSRSFEFRMTDEEVTSLAALELQNRPDFPFSDPQILFHSEKVYIAGKVEGFGGSPIAATIVLTPKVDSNGGLEINVEQAKLGNFNLPDSFVQNLTQTAQETLADADLNIQLQEIEILEGEIVISGVRQAP